MRKMKFRGKYYSTSHFNKIKEGLDAGLDISYLANPSLTIDQAEEILQGLLLNIDVSEYAHPSISPFMMAIERSRLEKEQSYSEELDRMWRSDFAF